MLVVLGILVIIAVVMLAVRIKEDIENENNSGGDDNGKN